MCESRGSLHVRGRGSRKGSSRAVKAMGGTTFPLLGLWPLRDGGALDVVSDDGGSS